MPSRDEALTAIGQAAGPTLDAYADSVCVPILADNARLSIALSDQTIRADNAELANATLRAEVADLREQLAALRPMRLGLTTTPQSVDEMVRCETALGVKLAARRTFTSGDLPATFAASPCSVDPDNGWLSAYSFVAVGPALDKIARGEYDKRLADWIASVPAGHPVDLAFCHEADSKVRKGHATVDQVNAAYVRARQVFDAHAPTNVRLAWCGTGYYWYKNSGWDVAAFAPAMDAAHIVTADPYGQGTQDANTTLRYYLEWVETTGKPGAVWEFSTNDRTKGEGYKATFIRDFLDLCAEARLEYACGFNSAVGGSQPLLSSPAYVAAFADAVRTYQGT